MISRRMGRIVPPPGVTTVDQSNVILSREDSANRMNVGAGISGPGFDFQFDQIQPGRYALVAQAGAGGKRYRGVQSIEIAAEDVRDLAIPLEPSIDLSGTVTVEGPDAGKNPPLFVSLVSGDAIPWNGLPFRASGGKDGSFQVRGVPPGTWDITAGPVPSGGYIKSMRLGDQDVLTEEMVIQPSTQAPLKIVIGTQAAVVRGDITSNGQPARAMVLLSPESRFRHVLSFYRWVPADANGHFEITNATPGTYQLYAFDEFDAQSIQDPEFLKPFESAGVTVTLREGENPAQKLSVISTNAAGRPASGEAQ